MHTGAGGGGDNADDIMRLRAHDSSFTTSSMAHPQRCHHMQKSQNSTAGRGFQEPMLIQRQQALSVKSQIANIFDFVGHSVPHKTTRSL